MTEKELKFLNERTPIYIDNDSALAIQVTNSNLKNKPWTEIFFNLHVQWIHTTRGYLKDNHIILYVNDFEVPGMNIVILQYIFAHFPNVEWIGLGCIKGEPGDEWPPKLVVKRSI